jgi:hypothetical protein
MQWADRQVLDYAKGRTVFAYVENSNDPIELNDGFITSDGYFWPHQKAPTRILSVLSGGLCTSYDEDPFDWTMFKCLGQGKVHRGSPPEFIPD